MLKSSILHIVTPSKYLLLIVITIGWIFFFHFLECQCYLKGTGGSNECDGNNGKCNLVPGCKNNFIGGHCEICIDPIPCYKQESSCYPCRK